MLNILNNSGLEPVLGSSIELFFLAFGTIATAVSIGLIIRSDVMFRIFKAVNDFLSTRKGFRALAISHDTSQLVMKYRLWFAGFIVVGASYLLYGMSGLKDASVAELLGLNFPALFVIWLVESTRLTLIAFSAFSLAVGVMLGLFPHAFSSIEMRLSQWISTRWLGFELEQMHMGFDNLVMAFPRSTGSVVLFPALAVALYYGLLLR